MVRPSGRTVVASSDLYLRPTKAVDTVPQTVRPGRPGRYLRRTVRDVIKAARNGE
ncbi:MAG: hypothetical protein Q8O53_00750 [Candidatus Moranbacteria bacterium]|nr:hypothetical protein [Candidatus Moranbacteria bacterium]